MRSGPGHTSKEPRRQLSFQPAHCRAVIDIQGNLSEPLTVTEMAMVFLADLFHFSAR